MNRILLVGLLAAAPLAIAVGAGAQSRPLEQFTAVYTNISNVGTVGAVPVTIRITRWTGDEEHQKLMKILADEGNEAFVRALQRADSTGSIGAPQELPHHLRYARQQRFEKSGRQIILVTDRPMSFAERVSGSRSRDYSVTWIDLKLDADGRGEGTMAFAAKLRLVGEVLGIENLGNIPAKLTNVKKAG